MGTTNILDINNRVGELEKTVSGGDSAQANKSDIATEFSTTTSYTAGCFVYYGGKLYQFNADHSAGAWDPTDVVEANVTDQVVSNKAAIDELAESYPASQVMMSDGVTSVEDALDELDGKLTFSTQIHHVNFTVIDGTVPILVFRAYRASSQSGDYMRVDFEPNNNRIRYRYYDSNGTVTYDKSATLA